MKYLCNSCKVNIWVIVLPLSQCPVCKSNDIKLVSLLNYPGSDIDVAVRMKEDAQNPKSYT